MVELCFMSRADMLGSFTV